MAWRAVNGAVPCRAVLKPAFSFLFPQAKVGRSTCDEPIIECGNPTRCLWGASGRLIENYAIARASTTE